MNTDVIRIKCPDARLDKVQRQEILCGDLKRWIYSDAMKQLQEVFGIKIDESLEFREYVTQLQKAAEQVWDFRRKKAEQEKKSSVERWMVEDEAIVLDNRKIIMQSAGALGLTDITEPLIEPDFICPLGGARMANLNRCEAAEKIMTAKRWTDKTVAALAGMRPVSDIERPYLKQYAPDAETEYDAVCGGLEKAFGLDRKYSERKAGGDSINSHEAVREYEGSYLGSRIYAAAAPSSEPDKRRADSVDTFMYFLDKFHVEKGQKILLVTNCIYQPRQLLNFIMLGLEYGLEVDCIGAVSEPSGEIFSRTANYLQEIKATIDTIKRFCEKYYQ